MSVPRVAHGVTALKVIRSITYNPVLGYPWATYRPRTDGPWVAHGTPVSRPLWHMNLMV